VVADHRTHMRHTDVEGDPHSPLSAIEAAAAEVSPELARPRRLADVEPGAARLEATRGGSRDDGGMRKISRNFVRSSLQPGHCGARRFLVSGNPRGWATDLGRAWADLLSPPRDWSVNSVCHFVGSRRFDT